MADKFFLTSHLYFLERVLKRGVERVPVESILVSEPAGRSDDLRLRLWPTLADCDRAAGRRRLDGLPPSRSVILITTAAFAHLPPSLSLSLPPSLSLLPPYTFLPLTLYLLLPLSLTTIISLHLSYNFFVDWSFMHPSEIRKIPIIQTWFFFKKGLIIGASSRGTLAQSPRQ